MLKKNSALLKAWVTGWLGAQRATAQSSIPLLKGMLVYEPAATKKETYVLLVAFPYVCREMLRISSRLCRIPVPTTRRTSRGRARLSLMLFVVRGSTGKLKEGLAVLSFGRRISRQSPFSPALKWDMCGSALWLTGHVLFAWCVKQRKGGPYSVKATSLDNFVAFDSMWTCDFSFPKDYHFNVIGQPQELKKPSCYIRSDCSNCICRSTKAFQRNT